MKEILEKAYSFQIGLQSKVSNSRMGHIKCLGKCLVVFIILIVLFSIFAYFMEDGMVFSPGSSRNIGKLAPEYRNPSGRGMVYEDVEIVTEDKVKLQAWFVKADSKNPARYRTLIFFHGNSGFMGLRMSLIEIFVKNMKTNVLMVSYRGYGKSEGSPSEKGLNLDA